MTTAMDGARRLWRAGVTLAGAVAATFALSGCMSGGAVTVSAETGPLQQTVADLQRRAQALRDIDDIKRLQRAYGYYIDAGQWDQVADLFSRTATLEIGLDGVFRGQDRVRQYFRAVGGEHVGLAPGQVNQYLQLMPVINLTPDGQHAKGTWRAVILAGQPDKGAWWGEGPYENEYVKENGVWKISALHWYQTLMTPYGQGGWAQNRDANGAHYIGASLTPDAPPTQQYKVWPGVYVPHFHFKDQAPSLRTDGARGSIVAAAAPVHLSTAQLRQQLAAVTQDLQRLEDQNAIEKLQRTYGYYIDKGLWGQAADLFAPDGEMDIAGRGAYLGKDHVLAYLRAIGPEGPIAGRLYDNMQLQPIVHVNPDGATARARWHLFAQLAQAGQFHEWGVGVYENEYVKRNGVWMIRRLGFYPTFYSPYEDGWAKNVTTYSRFEPALRPDRPAAALAALPAQAPYDYPNPVTGRHAAPPGPATAAIDAVGASPEAMSAAARTLEHRVGLLEDAAIIENLHAMYGYYLATLEWDSLTDLWAPEGTIEIALRGVYVGKPAVRRNLNLYGQQGLDDGVLHNHMQYQPVIDVANDGQTAKMRSRAFSMMGNFGKNGTWMGGIYENTYVKRDGIWRIQSDHVVNTYFAPYDVGWRALAARDAPGITASNPPDAPPTIHFEMYPRSFLPPFHYVNPVTGEAVQ
jgi:SnoaL-like domain